MQSNVAIENKCKSRNTWNIFKRINESLLPYTFMWKTSNDFCNNWENWERELETFPYRFC